MVQDRGAPSVDYLLTADRMVDLVTLTSRAELLGLDGTPLEGPSAPLHSEQFIACSQGPPDWRRVHRSATQRTFGANRGQHLVVRPGAYAESSTVRSGSAWVAGSPVGRHVGPETTTGWALFEVQVGSGGVPGRAHFGDLLPSPDGTTGDVPMGEVAVPVVESA
jgi:hypothetical protein